VTEDGLTDCGHCQKKISWRMALKMGDQQYSGGLLIHT